MKRTSAKLLVLAMAVILAFALCGCSRSELEGNWEATGYKINGEVQSFNEAGMSELDMSISLSKDGTIIVTTSGEDEEGTWDKDDEGNISVSLQNKEETLIREDNTLLMGNDTTGYVVFEKAD